MNELFLKIINMSISASWLILAVLILRLVLKKAPKWVNVLLWGIVAVRLICPLSFESALSLIPSSETIPLDIEMAAKPTIDSGVPAINSVVNPVLSSFAPPQHVLTSANPLQIWIPILNIIWLIGVGALLLYTAVSYWRLCRKVDTAVRYKGNIFQSENVSSRGFFFLWFKCQHCFRWQFLVFTVQKIRYHLVRKAICFHGIPISKSDDLCCTVLEIQ